jgi:hypothetical protein
LVVAVPAGVVAVGVAVMISPFGPVGIGRAAEPHPGVRVDGMVLAIGAGVVVVASLVAGLPPVLGRRGRRRRAPSSARTVGRLPATALAATAMTRTRRAGGVALGSAVVGVAVAAATTVGAWSLDASFGRLIADPVRYGVTCDAIVGNVGSPSQQDATQATLRAIPGISVAGLNTSGGITAGGTFSLVTYVPLVGAPGSPVISAGRAPATATEVALGPLTMRDLHAHPGSVVHLPPDDPSTGADLTVVGEAIVNNMFDSSVARGAVVTPEAFDRLAPGQLPQQYVVWVDPGVDRAAALAAVRAAFPTTYLEPFPPGAVRNLGLVRGQPLLLALLMGLVAVAALVHALVLSVRRDRHQIGVLKTLGFSRRQVSATVAWHATFLTGLALVVGVPAGVVLGRLIWSAIGDGLGVRAGPVVPVAGVLGAVGAALVAANLVAAGPAWMAARTSAARALRSE